MAAKVYAALFASLHTSKFKTADLILAQIYNSNSLIRGAKCRCKQGINTIAGPASLQFQTKPKTLTKTTAVAMQMHIQWNQNKMKVSCKKERQRTELPQLCGRRCGCGGGARQTQWGARPPKKSGGPTASWCCPAGPACVAADRPNRTRPGAGTALSSPAPFPSPAHTKQPFSHQKCAHHLAMAVCACHTAIFGPSRACRLR